MKRRAFSLLEVIIATAILAASSVMLMSMFSTGDRHASRADERTIAQMLCQSKLDELIADPSLVIPIQNEVIRQYPGWVWSLDVQETSIEKFVQVTVSMTRIPGMGTGADLDLATNDTASGQTDEPLTLDANAVFTLPKKPTYELTRYMRYDGDLTVFESSQFGSGGF